jgi:lipopolysaccharide export system permease protein
LCLEALKAFIAITGVFVLFYVSNRLVQLLADAAAGVLPANYIFSLLALRMADNLVLIIPASCFVALLLIFGRLYEENEMSVLAACGIGRRQVVLATLWFTLPAVMVVALFSFWLGPVIKSTAKQIEYQADAEAKTVAVRSGQFKSISAGEVIFFAEEVDPDSGDLREVFIQRERDGQQVQVVAAQARLGQAEDGRRFLHLFDGAQYEGRPGQADYRLTRFADYRIYLPEQGAPKQYSRLAARSTLDLMKIGNLWASAELQWRLAMPLLFLVLALLALPLMHTRPRAGKYGKLAAALVVYVLYANLITVGSNWMSRGVTPEVMGLWWTHGLVLATASIWLWQRQRRGGW